ncbi:MAG: hypothetical protein ACWGMY_02575 [Hyphomicrobiaceae bacterium]|jgi:hypothetical protein
MLDVVAASRSVSCFGWTRARRMALVLIARMVVVAGSSVVAPGAFAENGKVALTPGAPGLALAAPRAGDQSMIPGRGQRLVPPIVERACRQCRSDCYHDYRRHYW